MSLCLNWGRKNNLNEYTTNQYAINKEKKILICTLFTPQVNGFRTRQKMRNAFTLPMPHRVSISAVTLPTPPTPTIATVKVRIFCKMQNYITYRRKQKKKSTWPGIWCFIFRYCIKNTQSTEEKIDWVGNLSFAKDTAKYKNKTHIFCQENICKTHIW